MMSPRRDRVLPPARASPRRRSSATPVDPIRTSLPLRQMSFRLALHHGLDQPAPLGVVERRVIEPRHLQVAVTAPQVAHVVHHQGDGTGRRRRPQSFVELGERDRSGQQPGDEGRPGPCRASCRQRRRGIPPSFQASSVLLSAPEGDRGRHPRSRRADRRPRGRPGRRAAGSDRPARRGRTPSGSAAGNGSRRV